MVRPCVLGRHIRKAGGLPAVACYGLIYQDSIISFLERFLGSKDKQKAKQMGVGWRDCDVKEG